MIVMAGVSGRATSDMTRARMFVIASGHEDCDDLEVLRSDPACEDGHVDGLPVSGTRLHVATDALAPGRRPRAGDKLRAWGSELIDLFCARFERVPRCTVLDIDDTDDAVHGQQELASVQHRCRRLLLPADQDFRSDDWPAGAVAAGALASGYRARKSSKSWCHVIGCIHRNWPAVEIMVRGESHFATPEVMDLLEKKRWRLHPRAVHQHVLDRDRAGLE